jgi:penicillin amidase
MRTYRFLFSLVATLMLIWVLSASHVVNGNTLPPLGAFLNPFSGFWKNAEPLEGIDFKNATLLELKGAVKVVYDDLLVPHIFAENLEDALRVQGYLTAQHRLFQMDITARKAAGRLSEVLGERTFKTDRETRRKGLVFAAENDLIGWGKRPASMALLNAYAAGVNAWIDQLKPADYPIEFKLLNHKPEHWSPLKSALVTEAMAETLCSRKDDIDASNALLYFGRDTFDYLFPEWNPKQQPIIPDTGQWKDWHVLQPMPAKEAISTNAIGALFDAPGGGIPDIPEVDRYMVGSNNWALSGAKTKSGHPMLANDPHLNLTLPSIWFQVQIHTPASNSYGVSLPGTPGIVIGFNENTAWGVTNVGQDVSDFYTIKWKDTSRMQYWLDESLRTVSLRTEDIVIKGKPTFRDTVRYTVWGPMPYDDEPKNPLRDCALRWVALDIPEYSTLDIFMQLNAGKNYDDYQTSLKGFDAPGQNFVFASQAGDIAMQVQGKFPVRGKEQGRFVQDGSLSSNAWQSFIPWDQVPSMKNPSRGFVFSANQHSTSPAYPYYFVGDFEDYRSRRLFDRLSAVQSATIDSMKSFQLDNFSQKAADALPVMLRLLDQSALSQEEKKMVEVMEAWHYKYDADQLGATLFDSWCDSCYVLTWDEMDEVRKANKPMLYPDGWRWIDMMENDHESVFFDIKNTPLRETAKDVVLESFKRMAAFFKQNPDKNTAWGTSRPFAIKHLAMIDAFSRLDLKPGGCKSAPNAVSRNNGPSWRMLVELDDQVKAQGVFPGGQSGNPGSHWYDNMVDTWAKGEYYSLLFLKSPEEISERIMAKQTFSPQ